MTDAQYLATSFSGVEPEFRDGEILERNPADNAHGRIGNRLPILFWTRLGESAFGRVDTRVRIRPDYYLIPDYAVYWPHEPTNEIPEFKPLIVAEILSPDDKMSCVRAKLADYFRWGVRHVWLIDPASRVLHLFDGTLREVHEYAVPELGLTLTAAEIFA